MEENKKKKIFQIIITVVTFFVAFYGTSYLINQIKSGDAEIKKIATALNIKCPMMIDSLTRLDSASIPYDKIFQYNYTFVTITNEDKNIDKSSMQQFIKVKAQENLNSNLEMKYFRDNFITLKYNYNDKNGKLLFNFTVTRQKNNK
jgi:hypothetical protein